MMNNEGLQWGGCTLSAILTAVQTEHVFQIVSLVLTCLATLATLAFTLYKWYKEAKKDGKIDEEEIKEGIDIIKDGVEELVDKTKGDKK